MLLSVILIAIGFGLLIKGADWLVDGASALARKFNIPDLVIGLTIVAFGTSAPELVVNVFASIQGSSDIVFGNIIGSNTFNIMAILGIVGLIFPITVKNSTIWHEIPISILAIGALFVLTNCINTNGQKLLSLGDGLILMVLFAAFIWYAFMQTRNNPAANGEPANALPNYKIALLIILGLGGLIAGGKIVVNSAIEIATLLGVSEKVIGLTIVAIGTSLPELVTSIVAAFKHNNDIAIGNVVGSNIFNILFILSVSSIISPINYNTSFNFDLLILTIGSLWVFVAMFAGKKKRLDRWESAILLIGYIAYTVYLIKR